MYSSSEFKTQIWRQKCARNKLKTIKPDHEHHEGSVGVLLWEETEEPLDITLALKTSLVDEKRDSSVTFEAIKNMLRKQNPIDVSWWW